MWRIFHNFLSFLNNFMEGYYITSMITKGKVIIAISTWKGLKVLMYAIILPNLNYKKNCGYFFMYIMPSELSLWKFIKFLPGLFLWEIIKYQLHSTQSFDNLPLSIRNFNIKFSPLIIIVILQLFPKVLTLTN